jgi:hypothetical protein
MKWFWNENKKFAHRDKYMFSGEQNRNYLTQINVKISIRGFVSGWGFYQSRFAGSGIKPFVLPADGG